MSVAKDERQTTETLSFRCWRERCRCASELRAKGCTRRRGDGEAARRPVNRERVRISRGGFYVRVESSVASELESLRARFATNVVLANRSPSDSKIQDSASLRLLKTPSAVISFIRVASIVPVSTKRHKASLTSTATWKARRLT